MKFVILTGMSGAGKSTAIKMMEDIGFYCVDNLPIPLLEKFVELTTLQSAELQKVAVGIDIRSGQSFDELHGVLDHMKDNGVEYEILFLDAEDSDLVKRYKGNEEERKRLAFLKERADYIIDTSQLLTRELKAELDKIFIQNQDYKNLFITILSFGFKYGIPVDSDLVFDKENQDYVMQFQEANVFLDKLEDMLEFLIPNYITEGKNQLVISIGCTGGKHRSVTLANELYKRLSGKKGYGLKIEHRDIGKDALRGK